MQKGNPREQAKTLLKQVEKTFYKYLLTKDKNQIDRFFERTKKLNKLLEQWKV